MGTIVVDAPVAGTATAEARVLRAALVCIERFGPSKTTLDDIARESGVSRATIYRLFPGGRDTLFDAVLTAEVGRFFELLRADLERCHDLEDLLVSGLGGTMRFLLDHQALRSIISLEPVLLVPQLLFHRLEAVLALASAFAAPFLHPYLPTPEDTVDAAEHVVRIVLSYTLHPSDRLDPRDDASIRRLVRRHVLPAIAPVPRTKEVPA